MPGSETDIEALQKLVHTLRKLSESGKPYHCNELAHEVGPSMQEVKPHTALGKQVHKLQENQQCTWLFGREVDETNNKQVSSDTLAKTLTVLEEQIEKGRRRVEKNKTRIARRAKKATALDEESVKNQDSGHEAVPPTRSFGVGTNEQTDDCDSDASVTGTPNDSGRNRSKTEADMENFIKLLQTTLSTAKESAETAKCQAKADSDLAHASASLEKQRLEIENLHKQLARERKLRDSIQKLSQMCYEGLPASHDMQSPTNGMLEAFDEPAHPSTPFAPPLQASAKAPHQASGWVYILWDIENISIPRSLGNSKAGVANGAYRVANSARDFLRKKGVLAHHSREFFKLFYRPNNASLSTQSLRDLQRAGIELVATVSEKQEAADRLIEHEIKRICRALTEAHADVLKLQRRLDHVGGQLALLAREDVIGLPEHVFESSSAHLKAQQSTIVLISSDLDFLKPMELAYQCGFRVVIIHDEGLDGDRKETYMRHCHAKMYMWKEVLGKLHQEATVEHKRALENKNKPFKFEPLDDGEMIPIQRVIEEYAEQHTSETMVLRNQLAELLNFELGRRLPQDEKAIAVVEAHHNKVNKLNCEDANSIMVAVDINADSSPPRMLLPNSNRAIKHYIRRAEESTDILFPNEDKPSYVCFNREAITSPPRKISGKRQSSFFSGKPSRQSTYTIDSPSFSVPASPAVRKTSKTHSRQTSLSSVNENLFDMDFGLMSAGRISPVNKPDYDYKSPTPEWAPLQAPGVQRAQEALARWTEECSAKVIGVRTIHPVGESDYTVYIVQVTGPYQVYKIERRFTEFEMLHEAMVKCKLDGLLEPMPRKRIFNFAQSTIDERVSKFNRMLEQCQGLEEAESGPLLEFLTDLPSSAI